MGGSEFQGGGGTFRPPTPKPKSFEDLEIEDQIELKFFQRIINDMIKGQIDPDALRRLPDFQDSGVPMFYSNPNV